MNTKYVKEYISPVEYVVKQYRSDGVIRIVKEDNPIFKTWIEDERNILEIIPYKTPEPKQEFLEDLKSKKIEEINEWYKKETEKPLKVSENPEVFIKQTNEDLTLWEQGVKGFLLNAYQYGYFTGDNALTQDEISDLLVGTIKGSLIQKASKYSVNPIDYYGKPLFIDIGTMVQYTLKMAASFQTNFMRYHLLKNFVNNATSNDQLKYLVNWDSDLSAFGYPPSV